MTCPICKKDAVYQDDLGRYVAATRIDLVKHLRQEHDYTLQDAVAISKREV